MLECVSGWYICHLSCPVYRSNDTSRGATALEKAPVVCVVAGGLSGTLRCKMQ